MKVEISNQEVNDMVVKALSDCIKGNISEYKDDIKVSIRELLKKNMFAPTESQFDKQLHWSVEHAIGRAFSELVEEIDLKQLMKDEMVKLTQDSDLMKNLALEQIRKNFGLSEVDGD
ncbi:hypothetical protein KKJFFJLC_00048 [Vibrio phage vB_VpaS_PGB]|nr:hypothetical protein HHKILHMN_00049 [Vibrio phage vB_VpaS_PGA]WVH05591.1 hypothetical protein KKJFFJLC_00048 [Vibrio phage vB_VpaS_PGB]